MPDEFKPFSGVNHRFEQLGGFGWIRSMLPVSEIPDCEVVVLSSRDWSDADSAYFAIEVRHKIGLYVRGHILKAMILESVIPDYVIREAVAVCESKMADMLEEREIS